MGTVHAKEKDDKSNLPSRFNLPGDDSDDKPVQPHFHNRPNHINNLQGLRARVDKIHVDGLGRTKDDIVTNSIKELFDANTFEEVILKSQQVRSQLDSMGCFRNIGVLIDVSSGPNATPEGLEVTFQVSEFSRIVGGVNTYVGNNEGSVIMGVKMPNTCGRGERLQCEYTVGHRKTSNFSLMWMKPFPGRKFSPTFSTSLFQQASEYPWSGYSLFDRGVLLDLGFKTSTFTKHNIQWEGLLRNTSILSTGTSAASFSVREDCGPALKSIVRHIVSVDRRDDIIFPTGGTLAQFTSEVCGLGGGVAYLKNDLILQTNHEVIEDYVVQGTVQSGYLHKIHDTKLSDNFFLGGPMSIRGFRHRGAGQHKDGSSLGGTMYWASGLHLFAPLPFRPGKGGVGDLFRTHIFANAGNIFQTDQDNQLANVSDIFKNTRVSVGAGIAVRVAGMARFELNYCVPIRVALHDYTARGIQFGIGIIFL